MKVGSGGDFGNMKGFDAGESAKKDTEAWCLKTRSGIG